MHEHSNRSAPVKHTVIGLNSDDHNNPTRGPYPPTIVYHDGEKHVFSIQDPIYGNMEFLPELPTCSSITILDIEFSQLLYRLLFTCNAVSRLSKIHQAGAAWLWNVSTWNVTRLEHSIGVMLLIRKLKPLDLEQQLAGLLHDISHTAFSHVIDYMLLNDTDDFHEGIIHDIVNAPNSKFCHHFHTHHENSIDYEYLSNSSIINTEFSSCSNQESLMDILREFKMEHVMDKLMDLKPIIIPC
ncbi:hypothetical protein C9374_001327 [Naegleria lovaniensis]|uniref:HD domain-containing protein n=1 Tax=Naegleria lovaniensis TaxID=51637 RepID=A0AA88GXY6_NAELO|nr:uncharacterized protein C9374_001327 [Naegleria lovaniensis]KAG2387733.1 hypothetical protein C9374_001327 [Naegleria lovaniensis]